MATVIDRQIEAFRESVREEQTEPNGSLQDIVHTGVAVARLVICQTEQCREHRPSPAVAAELIGTSHRLLELMVAVQRMFEHMRSRGLKLVGEEEFEDAIVELREMMAFLQDAVASTGPPPASGAEQAKLVEHFKHLAQMQPPPQSWFEEDVTRLAGPSRS